MKSAKNWIAAHAAVVILVSCGTEHVSSGLETLTPAERAALLLERRDPEAARGVLLEALGSEVGEIVGLPARVRYELPELPSLDGAVNVDVLRDSLAAALGAKVAAGAADAYLWCSILASAVAQQVGIDPVDLALALAENTGAGSPLVALSGVLPEPSVANREQAQLAVSLLEAIPPGQRSEADMLKLSLFLTAKTAILIKSLHIQFEGELSPVQVNPQELTPQLALEIFAALVTASQLDGGDPDSTLAATASSIAAVVAEIEASEGEDVQTRLQNYLAN